MQSETCKMCLRGKRPRAWRIGSDRCEHMNQPARCDSVDQIAAEMLDSYARLWSRVRMLGYPKVETLACVSPDFFYSRLLALGVRI